MNTNILPRRSPSTPLALARVARITQPALALALPLIAACTPLKSSEVDTYLETPQARGPSLAEVHAVEGELEDVMEVMEQERVRANLNQWQQAATADDSHLTQLKLAIAYHEAALNFGPQGEKGYAEKAFEILHEPSLYETADPALQPFIFSYMGSSRALMGGEEKNLGYLRDGFLILDHAVARWGDVASTPRFMRGSVAEGLPPIFRKADVARGDFERMVELDTADDDFASDKTMSFVHYAMVKLDPERPDADAHLETALALDPKGEGSRELVIALQADTQGER